ncbi:MAG: TRAP transporter small permease [Woeseiaceae bacterium]
MKGLLRIVDGALSGTLVVLVAAMVISVTWQILSRYLFVVPAAWTEELARFLLIWIGMLGAAYAYRRRSHLGLDLLPGKLEGNGKAVLNIVTHLVCLSFAAVVLVVGGGSLVTMTWELRQHSAAMGVPIAFVYGVIPASGVLICLFAVFGMLQGPAEGND